MAITCHSGFNSRLIRHRKLKTYRLNFITHLERTIFFVNLEVCQDVFLSNLVGVGAGEGSL